MTITIDTSSPYVWVTILFFAALFITNLLIQVKSIQLKRRLIMQKERPPPVQLETALNVMDNVIHEYHRMTAGLADERALAEAECYIKRMNNVAAKLRKDAGL